MSDTTDNQILNASYTNTGFQDRCRLRFINAAIAATTEVISLTTNGATAAANNVLHFASVPGTIVQGMTVSDFFGASIIPAGTIVESSNSTTVTLNNNVTGAGVASGDVINFAPVSHAQRLAFAGALFAGNIDLKMLAMTVLANATIRAAVLAAPSSAGGNSLDSDIDFQVNSIFTGMAISRSW